MELIFLVAVGLMVVTLALLALPLMNVAKDAVRSDSIASPPVRAAISSTRSEREVERSVRGRLYGEQRR